LGLLGSLSSLAKQFLSLLGVLGLLDRLGALHLGIGVEPDEVAKVLEGIPLEGGGPLSLFLGSEMRLDFLRVDQTIQIGVGESNSGKSESDLELRTLLVCSVDRVELLKSALSPDDKSSKMTSGSELEEVQSVNGAELDTGNVTEGSQELAFFIVDDQGTTTFDISPVPHLSATRTDFLRVNNSLDIGVSVEGLQDGNGALCLLDAGNGFIGDDEGDFGDLIDSMTAGEDQGRRRGGGECRNEGITPLVLVDSSMPLSVGLGGAEHATTSTHVSEGSLTSSMGTTSRNSGNTGDGATSTPRFGRGLHAGPFRDGVWLSLVAGNVAVDVTNDVQANGSFENGSNFDLARRLAVSC